MGLAPVVGHGGGLPELAVVVVLPVFIYLAVRRRVRRGGPRDGSRPDEADPSAPRPDDG